MMIVTGANGQLGRAVVEGLLTRVSSDRIVASVRDPAKATALAERGVEVRAGDFSKPDELATAFEGAEQVLVVSPDQLGETGRRLSCAAIEAARTAGARRVLYTSHAGTHADSPFNDHDAIETFLAGVGIPFTSLRHGFYAESAFTSSVEGSRPARSVRPKTARWAGPHAPTWRRRTPSCSPTRGVWRESHLR